MRTPAGADATGRRAPDKPPGGEPDNLSLSLWLRLIKAHNLVLREVRRRLDPDLTLPQWDVLAQLSREEDEDGVTPAFLSRRLIVTAGNLTGIVDRLVRRGLLRRDVDPADRRKVRLRLTAVGRTRVGKMLPRHARDLEEILSDVPRAERATLRGLLGRFNEALESGGPDATGEERGSDRSSGGRRNGPGSDRSPRRRTDGRS